MNKKYYAINFILHIIYGCVIWSSLAYGLSHASYGGFTGGGGEWNTLAGLMLLIFGIPAPIITNVLCIRACYRNTKLAREFFKCIGIAILAGYLSGFIVTGIGMSLEYR